MTTSAPSRTVLVKDRVWPQIEYVPHVGQEPIHNSRARNRLASCGRRFGKSKLGGNELVPEALYAYTIRNELQAGDRREFWIVGPEYSDSEKEFRVVYNSLAKLKVPFDHPGTYNNPESGTMSISLWDGKFQVHAKSAKYPSTLVGEGLSGVIMAEAAKLKQSVWTKFIRPTLADWRGWSLFLSTPEGKNWFYDLWRRGQDPADKRWESWRLPSWVNDVVFPDGRQDEEILDMEADMSAEKFAQEVGADFTEFVGRVFKDFDEEVHVTDLTYDNRYPVYGACDYGWTNPFVWLVIQVDVWDNVYVLAEYRATQKDTNDIARDLSGFPIIRQQTRKFFPDPAAPGDSAIIGKHLRIPYDTSTGGELKHRLEYIRQALKLQPEHLTDDHPDKRPKLFIDRSCVELIREMQDYRYPESKEEALKAQPEQPLDKDDHGPEALGRFYRGYFGPLEAGTEKSRARVRKANLTGARRR